MLFLQTVSPCLEYAQTKLCRYTVADNECKRGEKEMGAIISLYLANTFLKPHIDVKLYINTEPHIHIYNILLVIQVQSSVYGDLPRDVFHSGCPQPKSLFSLEPSTITIIQRY